MGVLDFVKTVLKYFFLLLFSLILIVDLFALILLFGVQGVALNPDVYKAALDKTDAYGRAYAFVNEAVMQSPLAMLASEIKVEEIIPRPWLKAQVNNLVDHAFAYVKGQELYLNLTVYTAEPKQKAFSLLESKASKLLKANVSGLPSNFSASQFMPLLKAKVDEQIPDALNLAEKLGGNPLEPVRQAVSVFYTALVALAVVALVLFIIVALIAHKLNSVMRWVGFPLVVSGALCFLVLAFAKSQVAGLLAGIQGPPGQFVAPIAAELFTALESSVSLWAGLALVLGLALFAGSFFVKLNEKEKPLEEPAERKECKEQDEGKEKKEKKK